MIIVNATKEHLDMVYELVCELESKNLDKSEFSKVYHNNLNNSNIYYILAADDTRVIGFASLHIQQLLHHCGNIGEIQELVISKDRQGSNVGSELINRIKVLAVENNCSLLEVSCNKTREKSHKFYLKHGMESSHLKFTCPLE